MKIITKESISRPGALCEVTHSNTRRYFVAYSTNGEYRRPRVSFDFPPMQAFVAVDDVLLLNATEADYADYLEDYAARVAAAQRNSQ